MTFHSFASAAVLAVVSSLGMASLAAAQTDAAAEPAKAEFDASIFPEPKAGYLRHVLPVPAQGDEGAYRLEIVAGQTMQVDCNRVVIHGDLEEETLNGWGYSYYEIDDVGAPAVTQMGCPDNSLRDEFVTLYLGSDALIRYNSKLPVVIYAPENLTLGYRIWQTDGQILEQSGPAKK